MSKDRLSKKDLKTNELEVALEGARDFVVSHEGQAKRWGAIAAAAIAVVALVWGGISWRTRALDRKLSTALATLDAPLVTDGVPASPGVTVYKDAAERTNAARKQLQDVAGSSGRSAKLARMMLLALEPGPASAANLDGARSLARSMPGSLTAGFAAMAAIEAEAAAGRTKEAIEAARKHLSASSPPVPKDVLLLTLGRLQERSGQVAEARSSYQRLVAEFPDSPMRFEAQQKLQGL